MSRITGEHCRLCGGAEWNQLATFDAPQPGENTFGVKDYYRELWQCTNCGLYVNRHDHDFSEIYAGAYRDAAYQEGKGSRFQKIMSLPVKESDNKQRIKRIVEYIEKRMPLAEKSLCDIGSGMGVFPAGMFDEGWDVTAIDPDDQNLRELRNYSDHIRCVTGYFPGVEVNSPFTLVTFNKVLEHIPDIVGTLSAASHIVPPDGCIYVELPDGESAYRASPARQEFFLEHYYAFSMPAINLLARRAGMRVDFAERIKDPSGKYTLYAFVTPIKERE